MKPYRRKRRRTSSNAIYLWAAALCVSIAVGGTITVSPGGWPAVMEKASTLMGKVKSATDTRERPPQEGDSWSYCDEARSAGTAPIYAGEPGYRVELDRDADGVACEPYRGW